MLPEDDWEILGLLCGGVDNFGEVARELGTSPDVAQTRVHELLARLAGIR